MTTALLRAGMAIVVMVIAAFLGAPAWAAVLGGLVVSYQAFPESAP